MSVSLYEHQRLAVEKMRSGSVLCGGVGSGKSRTALSFFVSKVCGGRVSRPGKNEFVELANPMPLYIITTASKRDRAEWEMECAPFLISSGAESLVPLTVDSWNNIGKYVDVENAFFIFDEQRIVGTGKWAMTFVKIAKKNKWVLLSATPGDTWFDYWAIFVANGYYKNVTDFRRQHVIYRFGAKFPQIDRYVGTKRLERLRSEVLIPMDFEKKNVRHHQWVKVGYDENSYLLVAKDRWNPELERPIRNVSEACYMMRKAVNSDERRCEAVSNIVESHPRVIIFYNYDYELEMLRELSAREKWTVGEWNGHRHDPLPDSYSWVYLVQYTAGAEGWNCTETDTVIFYSQNYSYKIMEQACGRIDRINTKFVDLYYFHIFSDAPIDRAIRACVKRKKVFNESAFLERISREKQPL
jgi:hypothetical protein